MDELVCGPRKRRVDSLHECRSRFEKTLASELADAFSKQLPAWLAKQRPALIFLIRVYPSHPWFHFSALLSVCRDQISASLNDLLDFADEDFL